MQKRSKFEKYGTILMFNGWFVITCISNYEVPHKCLITFFVKLCHWSNLLCLYCEKYRIAFGSKFCFVNWTVVTEAKLIWNFPVVLGFGRCFIHSGSIFVKFWQWLLGFDDRLSSKNYSSWLIKRSASILHNTRKQTFQEFVLKKGLSPS